jgi:hypothetical protein
VEGRGDHERDRGIGDVKNVPGRPKTDRLDAVWLAKLAERGMLRASFVPPKPVRHLRDLTRTRAVLTEDRTRHMQRIEVGHVPCACRKQRPRGSRCLLIFVDDAAGSVAPADAEGVEINDFGGERLVRRRAGERHVRSVGVVVSLVVAQDAVQVWQVPDERAIEQLAAAASDPAFHDRVHARRSDRTLDRPWTGVGRHRIDAGG